MERRINFFYEQYWYAEKVINHYLSLENYKGLNVLEVGSAEGGALKYFFEQGANCYGLEISESRNTFAKEYIHIPEITLINGDICAADNLKKITKADLIIIRDVIEHIRDKKAALENMNNILKDNGIIFLSFPPKFSPYGGHQQNVKKAIGKLPFIHLLPNFLYRNILKIAGENGSNIIRLLDTKSTMISIRNIEKLFTKVKLTIYKKDFYLIRPCFEKRFGIKPKKIILNKCPVLREFFTLGALYLLKKNAGEI